MLSIFPVLLRPLMVVIGPFCAVGLIMRRVRQAKRMQRPGYFIGDGFGGEKSVASSECVHRAMLAGIALAKLFNVPTVESIGCITIILKAHLA